jgi:hypothetical protein
MEDAAIWIFVTFAITFIITKLYSPEQCAAPHKEIM